MAFGLWACPGWVFGQGVINQSSTNGANLDFLFNQPTNTVTIISGVTIDNNTNGGIAVSGSTRAWGLTNAATINGNTTGVYLDDGGTLNNQPGGSILGGNNALEIFNGTMAVDNASLISGGAVGMSVNQSGVITNESGGIIVGGVNGINGFGSSQTVFNAGTIIGTNNTGIAYSYGGSVDNLTGGLVEGPSAIFLNGGFSYVTNSGSIIGQYAGVNLFSGGSLNNLTNGIISGEENGVSVEFTGFINNAGTIIGINDPAILLNSGGNINNQRGGIIASGTVGLEIDGGSGAVTNAGTIIGLSGTAIGLGFDNCIVTLQTGSDVQGDIAGGGDSNMVFLQGDGSFTNNFLYFGLLTVQADGTGWNLSGTNTFSTGAEIQSGLLYVNGVLATPLLTVDQGATLGGAGCITGSVTIKPAGTVAPGTMTNIALLTISNVTLQGTALMKLTSINANNDQLISTNITYGGTLTVTNLSMAPLTNGENYQLFSAASYSGEFNAFNLPPPGAGLAWNWNPTDGLLTVVTGPASPPKILSQESSATNFTFSFATAPGLDYTIWGNTNLATSNWMVVTNFIGDGLTDPVNVLVSPCNPAEFFRVTTFEDIISP